jgi:hypothetical protein
MHLHLWIILQRAENLRSNPRELTRLRVTNCQNTLGPGCSSQKFDLAVLKKTLLSADIATLFTVTK